MSKVLVVTGGGSGIGAATVSLMANNGWTPVLIDVNEAGMQDVVAELSDAGITAGSYTADVSDADDLAHVAKQVKEDFGNIECLVTSAGILNNSQTLLEMDVEEHDRVWDINYFGTLRTIRAFADHMIEEKSGSIVTLGSITGMGAFPLPAYSPSKTAIMRLTQILAVELGRFGVRVNGVAPTYVLTPAIEARISAGQRDPDSIKKAGAIEMFVRPSHIADVINFLCSDAAAAISGTMLPVDAGWEAATTYRAYAGGVPWEKN